MFVDEFTKQCFECNGFTRFKKKKNHQLIEQQKRRNKKPVVFTNNI